MKNHTHIVTYIFVLLVKVLRNTTVKGKYIRIMLYSIYPMKDFWGSKHILEILSYKL